jgi:3-hydroxyacyl-[acyl-carrier protein] dehydratase/trans-2-decenoyl-[acyl-carrier protein] isomerase
MEASEYVGMQQNSFSREELIECGHGRLFGSGNAQLPLPGMLMFDRITHVSAEGGVHGSGEMIAELDLNPDLWFFKVHFEGDPVMPGCLGLDALWQMLGFFLAWKGNRGRGRALGVQELKFRGQVLPHNKLVRYRLDIRRTTTAGFPMAIADGKVSVDDADIYFAKNLKAGLFIPHQTPPGSPSK